MARDQTAKGKVLYIVICAAPPATQIQELITLAQQQHWDVRLVATPEAVRFVDLGNLSGLTKHPVRVTFKDPGEEDPLPKPDAIAVVPATFNTINKWAAGVADTLAVSLLCEHLGRGTPLVAVPCLKEDLARHPAFPRSVRLLKRAGVRLLYEPRLYVSPQIVPWATIMSELDALLPQQELANARPPLVSKARRSTARSGERADRRTRPARTSET